MFLGVSFLFVAFLDLFHTLSYKGMGVFPQDNPDFATQVWVASRLLESTAILAAPLFLKRNLNLKAIFWLYLILSGTILWLIFYAGFFPVCYIPGKGLTLFKSTSEYIISGIFISGIFHLVKKKDELNYAVYKLLVISITFSIASELAFSRYSQLHDFLNITGHMLKFISVYLIYKAIIQTGLKRPYDLLFKNLNEQKEEINRQKEQLEEANSAQKKFFSIIAHDLKNPFNSLLSSSNLLISEYDHLQIDEAKELIGNVNFAANNLFKLINDLLLWASTQAGGIEYLPAKNDLKLIATQVIALLKLNSDEKGIEVDSEIEEETFAFFDENTITTVLRNLVSNAIKFTNSGGKVTISAEELKNEIRISVNDNGTGIQKDKIENIFRIDKKHTTYGTGGEKGTGLGLILCKEFVEQNKGKLTVKSEFGKGSCFSFTLPADGELTNDISREKSK